MITDAVGDQWFLLYIGTMIQLLHYTMLRSSLSDCFLTHRIVNFVSFKCQVLIQAVIICCDIGLNNIKQHFPRRGRLCVRNPKGTAHTPQLIIYYLHTQRHTHLEASQNKQMWGETSVPLTHGQKKTPNAVKAINLLIHTHDRTQTLSSVTR